MIDRMPPQADGLYDPRYEHDACGVAMVARLDNVPGHDVVVKALEALDNLEHRGAEGADIRTGDGAGLLLQLPHALLPRHRRLRAARARALRRLRLLPAARRDPPPPDRGAARAQRPRRGPARARLARRADRRGPRRRHGQRLAPAHPPAVHRGGPRLRARPGRVRAQAVCHPPHRRARHRPGVLLAVVLEPDLRLQGHAQGAPAAQLLPRPAGRALRQRAGARPQPLLDEHLPELGARPSLSRDLPQRRDQHARWATSTGCAPASRSWRRSSSASTCRRCCPSCARAAPTPRPSTTCSSCSCSPAGRCRTR